jgi:Fe-S-cluster-containing hydrogenase component 2
MTKQLILKPEKCMNCRTCEMVCSFEHFEQFNPLLSAVTVIDYTEEVVTIPVMCLQCEDPSCERVCPVGAIHRNAAGIVAVDNSKCIVCRLCTQACAMGNISYSPLAHKVFKCDLCGGDPQCVKHCSAGAILYEDPADDFDRKRAVANTFKEVFGEEVA